MTRNHLRNPIKVVFTVVLLCAVIIIFMRLTSGASKAGAPPGVNGYSAETIIQYKTAYVGDNSKVVNLLRNLPYATFVKEVSLKTDARPYEITVQYVFSSDSKPIPDTMQNNAIIVFSLVGNVDAVNFKVDTAEGEHTYRYTRTQLQEAGVHISRCSQLILEVEQKRKEEQQVMKSSDALNKSLGDAEKKLDRCRIDLQMAQNEYDLTKKQCTSLERQYAQSLDQARPLVEQYGVDDLSVASLDFLLENLTGRRDKWQTRQAEKEARAKLINAAEIELARKQTLHHKLDEELEIKRKDLDNLQDELHQINRERQERFDDKNTDDEEKRLMDAVRDAPEAFQKESDQLRNAEQDLKNLKEKIEAASASTQARAGDLAQMEQILSARLTRLGFADEAEYRDSCLNEAEFTKLHNTAESLRNEQLEISTLIQDKTRVLKAERDKKLTEQPYSEVQNHLSTLEADIGEIQREIGALKLRLDEDEQARESQAEMMKNIDSQTEELARWNIVPPVVKRHSL